VDDHRSQRPLIDLAGMRFGRLLVIEQTEKPTTSSPSEIADGWWRCSCNCGAEVVLRGARIRQGTWTCRYHRQF
jgi:hypothetical protein